MTKARTDHSCARIRCDVERSDLCVVVVGGRTLGHRSKEIMITEVLDPESMNWTIGEPKQNIKPVWAPLPSPAPAVYFSSKSTPN